jgi:hypothetical protein
MPEKFYVTDLIQKVVDSSFFVETPKGKERIVEGSLFHYPGKYFYLNDVLEGILKLYKDYGFSVIELADLHDILFASYISDKEILNAIKSQ